MFEM